MDKSGDSKNQRLAIFPGLDCYQLKRVRKTDDCKRLGSGSFGIVDELYVNGTLCAAKQLHESLLDPRTEGVDRVISRFVEECRIMASVRHPNIVQFLGLHQFPNCSYPTLVMELLAMSLEDLLMDIKRNRESLPFSLKISILSDTAKGLVYLHNHDPQIIHRDLTSRNILLSLELRAKITDLGNALIIDSQTVAQTMTTAPGAAVYMPPEATQSQAKYDFTIDMFSYGILSLYTTTEEFPGKLLPATYVQCDKKLYARSEIERREKYIEILHQTMGEDHLLTQLIKRCLSNIPDERPSALQALEGLNEISKSMNVSSNDVYHKYQNVSKLDLVKLVGDDSHDKNLSLVDRGRAKGLLQMADTSQNGADPRPTLEEFKKIEIGVPGNLELVKSGRQGSIHRKRKSVTKREYTFKINTSDTGSKLVYYEEVGNKIKGEVNLAHMTKIKASDNSSEFSFTIFFKGKEEPMKLIAASKDERDNWTKAITQFISPSKQHFMHQRTSEPLPTGKHPGHSFDDMHRNVAYMCTYSSDENLPTALPGSVKHSGKIQVTPDITTATLHTESDYSFVHDTMSESPPLASELEARKSLVMDNSSADSLSHSLAYDKLEHPTNTSSSLQPMGPGYSSLNYMQGSVTVSPTNTSPMEYQKPFSKSKFDVDDMAASSFLQPTRRSQAEISELSLPLLKTLGELETKQQKLEMSVPMLQVDHEPSDDSTHFLQQKKLTKSENISFASLLVTGDSQDMSEKRPEWAKASVVPTPIHSPLPKEINYSSLTQQSTLYIERSALQDLQEIGEGQFGKIYKATLIQDASEMTVAVKTIKQYKSEQETSEFLHEMKITMDLTHPNIIHLYGIVDEESPWLILQYFPNGDLKNYLIRNKHSVDQLIKFMIHVAMGMHYITEKAGLVHRDLAARNVMVDDQKTCKVADFGLLREIPKDDTIYQSKTEIPLPIRWMAPESLKDRKFSPATDVWSFGVLLWEMYHPEELPYAEISIEQFLFKLVSGHRLSIPSAYPSIVARIMKACWQKEPEKRPSFQLISSLLTKYNDFKLEDS